jgi:peroxiredoxin
MSSRLNSNTVLLTVFILILVGAGVDYGRRVLGGTKPETTAAEPGKPPASPYAPSFKVGDVAPDFALPDAKGKVHKLSDLVKGKTMLFFACGCQNCKQVQTWLANMRDEKKGEIPPVITITSAPPESEAAWFRDTALKQTMLYYAKGVTPDPMDIYKGKPCPRIYILNPDRTVKFIGSSMAETKGVEGVGMQMAKQLVPGMPSTPEGLQKLMMKKDQKLPPTKPAPKAIPELPPYAQPQSSLPGA